MYIYPLKIKNIVLYCIVLTTNDMHRKLLLQKQFLRDH